MKCPKYIRDLCLKRAKAAEKFCSYDWEITNYLDKHHIEVEEYDIHTGCESIVNPRASSYRIIQAIEDYEND